MSSASAVSWFHTPVGYQRAPNAPSPNKKIVQKWLIENKNLNFFEKNSYGTYIGALITLLGIISTIFGIKKDNPFFKWTGIILGLSGAVTTVIGKLCGCEYDGLEKLRNKAIIQPNSNIEKTPKELGIPHEEISIDTPESVLKGYYFPNPIETKKTVIILGGSRYSLSKSYEKVKMIQSEVPVNIVMVDYRGFGNSTSKDGTVTFQGLINDAREIYDYIVREKKLTADEINIFGASLGGAVSIELANQEGVDINTLVVQSSFTKTKDVGESLVGKVTSSKLVQNLGSSLIETDFDSEVKIKTVRAKNIIVCHGKEDEFIPHTQGERLFNAITLADANKCYVILDGSKHDDFMDYYFSDKKNGLILFEAFRTFVDNSTLPTTARAA